MSAICDLVGIDAGSENCLLCVNHGCEGYKKAKRNHKIEKAKAMLAEKDENERRSKEQWVM